MNISPETKKISEIFSIEGKQLYKIPIYQRNYSWMNKQIESLIDDISSEDEGYYIGNLLITKNNDDYLEIVDGQQRLTTIALILIAVYECSRSFDSSHDLEKGSIQNDIRRKLLINGVYPNQRYFLINSDDAIFLDLLKIVVNKEVGKWGHRKFGKRYKEIVNIVREKFNTFEDLHEFYNKLNAVEILKISVTKLSDAFSIFSALNSKGLPLTLVDLLKNEFLKVATEENRTESDSINSWEALVEKFSVNKDVSIGEVTQFLLNNYDALEGNTTSSITKSKALDKYIELIKENSSRYIDILRYRADWFVYLKKGVNDMHSNPEVNQLVSELVYLDASQAFPLLLLLFTENKFDLSDQNLIDILKYVTRFFIIRNVTLRPKASNVRSMFVGLNRKILKDQLQSNDIVELIKEELQERSDSTDEFISSLKSDGIYDKNKSTTRYILIRLERKFGTLFDKSNPDTLEDYITPKKNRKQVLRWTIEHILPQGKTLPDYWQKEVSPEDSTAYKGLQEEYVHKLGNLTLTPYNSELGQKDFIEKRDKVDNDNYVGLRLGLYLNDSIKGNNNLWEDKNGWSTKDIDKRTEFLASKLVEMLEL